MRPSKLEANLAILHAPLGPSNSYSVVVGAASTPDTVEIGTRGPTSCALGGRSKRALDIALALSLLVLLAPLMLTVALLIRATSGGSVIFSQRRIGLKGRSFLCLKFRTMVPNAEEALRQYLNQNSEATREWSEHQKIRDDPRVTRLGWLLRRSSIDEIPQLINVLRGDMSLIGPRPIVASELGRYGEFRRHYLGARPGLTGMWQVSGRSSRTYQDRVALDRYYVRRWSIWLDLWILFETIPAVLRFDDAS